MSDNISLTEKGFTFKNLFIIDANGESIDIYPLLIELNIFEDIYNSTMSGNIIISDSVEMFSNLPISGFEFLSICIEKPGYADNILLNKVFRIYKAENNFINQATRSNQVYTLHFCSEENIISATRLISKSYVGVNSSTIIKDILLNYLQVSSQNSTLSKEKYNPKNIEESSGLVDIIIPYLQPLQAAFWLSSRTMKYTSNESSSNFLFYENRDGFNFKSIESLFKQPTKIKYTFKQKNIKNENETLLEEYYDVIKYEIMNSFDILSAITSGMYSSTLKTVDLVRLRADDTAFDYDKHFNKTTHINNDRLEDNENKKAYPFHNFMEDRTKKKVTDSYSSLRRMYPTNKGHSYTESISTKQPGIIENHVEQWMLQRISQINQLNFFKLKLVIPGDVHLTIGDIIEFNLPLIERQDPTKNMNNPYYSGRYLITAVRHKINYKSYEMIVEATRDCLNKEYPTFKNDSILLKEIMRR